MVKFCLTTWVHHKIFNNDTFWAQFCSSVKTTLYVCIETNTFQKSELLALTRINMFPSQNFILLLDANILKLYYVCFTLLSIVCMLVCPLHHVNNNVITETRPLYYLFYLFRVQNHNETLHYISNGFIFRFLFFVKYQNFTKIWVVPI